MTPIRTLALAALVLALGTTWWVRHPLRTRIPEPTAHISTLQNAIERLDPKERRLVLGYLLRQRQEVQSLRMRDAEPLTARTFREALPLQRAFLETHGYAEPEDFLRNGLFDQALQPLRRAVHAEMLTHTVTSQRELRGIPAGAGTRYGNDPLMEEDKPVLVVTVRVHNRSGQDLAEVKGSFDIRPARYPLNELGMLFGCYLETGPIPANQFEDVRCGNANLSPMDENDRKLVGAAERDLFPIWRPRELRFADGTVLKEPDRIAMMQAPKEASGKLWGLFPLP